VADQAQSLRELVWRAHSVARVLAVTSGKGGVGKSNTSVNLAIALARQGKRVILIDADLGLANVEVLMGFNSVYTLQDVIDGERGIRDVLVRAPGGIQVVPGTSGLAKMADLPTSARQNVLKGLRDLHDQVTAPPVSDGLEDTLSTNFRRHLYAKYVQREQPAPAAGTDRRKKSAS